MRDANSRLAGCRAIDGSLHNEPARTRQGEIARNGIERGIEIVGEIRPVDSQLGGIA